MTVYQLLSYDMKRRHFSLRGVVTGFDAEKQTLYQAHLLSFKLRKVLT